MEYTGEKNEEKCIVISQGYKIRICKKSLQNKQDISRIKGPYTLKFSQENENEKVTEEKQFNVIENKVETTQFLKEKETLIGIKYKFSNYKFVNNGIKTNEDVIVKEIIKLP